MERSKLIMSITVGLMAVLIIWRVGFYPPVPERTQDPSKIEVAAEPNAPGELRGPSGANALEVASDANEPEQVASDVNEPEQLADANEPEEAVAVAEPDESAEPNEPMEYVNLRDVQMRDIIQKLGSWTGKAIIPTDESMRQKVTIYATERMPRSEALAMIYAALKTKGYIAEHTDKVIYIKPITDAKYGEVPTIAADYPLALIENKDQIVQKFFTLKNYSASQMSQIIVPLVGEYGYVSADEETGSLLVIDTVKNLLRIGRIIEQFDAVGAEDTVTEVFEVRHGNPTEIVTLLQTLLESGSTSSSRDRDRNREADRRPPFFGRPPGSSSSSSGSATSIAVGTSRTPAVLIPETKRNWIIAKASVQDLELIREWLEKLDKPVRTVLVDQPLTAIENKNQIVQKFFNLRNYSPTQMSQVIGPLLSEEGYVSADESTRTLLVIDTVENLVRIEGIVEQFDVPEAEPTVTEIFQIRDGDPSEIVQLLRILMSDSGTGSYGRSSYGRSSSGRSSYDGGSYGRSSSGYSSSRSLVSSASYRSGSRSGGSNAVIVGTDQLPVVLIPDPKRKWIIARASAEAIKQIGEWIDRLDLREPVQKEYDTIPITYASVSEVADRLNEALLMMPGSEVQGSVLVQAMEQARQIVVFGREDMRELVKKLVQEIDVPTGMFQTEHFKLKYADPDEIKEKIEELYAATATTSASRSSGRYSSVYSYGSYRGSSSMSAETVKAISYVTLKQVTVIASADNMEKVRKQIAEWDVPIDVEQLKPRIIELHNSDPVQMAQLLRELFSEEGSGSVSVYTLLLGNGGTETREKIVGPLYGQLTFEEVPGTKKIIVISKIPEAYDVVESLILDLDREEMGEVPKVLQLKYADPEDLSERLNAMFVEAGQQARIRLTSQGLSTASEMSDSSSTQSTQSSNSSQSDSSTYTPPWSGSGARSSIDEEQPISNVIGRIRFVPDPHTKSIMTLAPPEFMDEIEGLIAQLDVPGKQVMIEAIIVEIEHSKLTSLGVQLATNPAAFGTLGENALLALSNLTHFGTAGTASGHISPTTGQFNTSGTSGTTLGIGTDVYGLIDFLIKTTHAKILNQQTLWTKDNEEASFFKGSEVAFLGSVTQAINVGTQQDITFEKVGMELRARPSITPEDKVDMVVNVNISSLTSDLVNNQPVRSKMNTTTNMIVENKQTLLLGGILFQKDSKVERKLPGFGDVPLVGGLFRHNSISRTNSEMLVFMTPHVIDESAKELPKAVEEKVEKLKDAQEDLQQDLPYSYLRGDHAPVWTMSSDPK